MVAPKMNWQISIGNVIQIAGFVVALALGWATLSGQVNSNTTAINNAMSIHDNLETRLRTLENTSARSEERLNNILTLLAKIDAKLENFERNK